MNQALEQWLTQATRGLAKRQRAHMRQELAEHYRDAVTDYLNQGYSVERAERQALLDLGDPDKTALAFWQHTDLWNRLLHLALWSGGLLALVMTWHLMYIVLDTFDLVIVDQRPNASLWQRSLADVLGVPGQALLFPGIVASSSILLLIRSRRASQKTVLSCFFAATNVVFVLCLILLIPRDGAIAFLLGVPGPALLFSGIVAISGILLLIRSQRVLQRAVLPWFFAATNVGFVLLPIPLIPPDDSTLILLLVLGMVFTQALLPLKRPLLASARVLWFGRHAGWTHALRPHDGDHTPHPRRWGATNGRAASRRLRAAGMLAVVGLLLSVLIGRDSRSIGVQSNAYVPLWPLPALYQATPDDWVQVERLSSTGDGAFPILPDTLRLRLRYNLVSAPAAQLKLELRSRLDLDMVDLGTEYSNLLTEQVATIRRGAGEEIVQLALQPQQLIKFPPGSQLVLVAYVYDPDTLTKNYFRQAFADLGLTVPDLSPTCRFDPARDTLKVIRVRPPAGAVLSESTPKASVTIQYQLTSPYPHLFTLVAGLVNPAWDGRTTNLWTLEHFAGSLTSQSLDNTARGTVVLNLYSWFPSEATRHILDENGQVALMLALECGYHAYGSPHTVYTQVFAEQRFTFAASLRTDRLQPTVPPMPTALPRAQRSPQ